MPTEPPSSTYRVQLHGGWTFDDAARIAGYLTELGVSHMYCSPYLAAAPGSMHGYDVVDHGRVDEERGGAAGRERLVAALREAGLGQVLDIVPNHVSVARAQDNPWWWDVLLRGPGSEHARHFDVDWAAADGRVVLPVLGGEPGELVERGELTVEDGVLRYHEQRFPLAAGTESVPLPELLDHQHYRLAHWREAAHELNYRRFFDVTSLAAIRVELDEVFDASHRLVTGWVHDGSVDGLRVDHPDGLADPAAYFARLRAAAGERSWLVAEKILEHGERLPSDWPVDGTTGYDAAALVTGLFVDPAGEQPLTALYAELTGERATFADAARDAKRQVLRDVLGAEVARLGRVMGMGAADDTVAALTELLVAMPVYRTYLRPGEPASPGDLAVLRAAAAAATIAAPHLATTVEDIVRRLLDGDPPELTVRFQQTSGAATAKGVEDTAFYRYHRLAALNEVGGDPGRWGVTPREFHEECERRQRDEPLGMTSLSTHDTKRSEDVRARLAVLSELPEEWAPAARRWFELAERHRTGGLPDANTAYLLFQTLVGAHPLPTDRALAYAEKASREAKRHTSWVDPDERYDEALRHYVSGVLGDPELSADIAAFAERIEPAAQVVSLAQKLVQLTMPGVPDVYQGTEVWDHSLVDPDNRRPVAYDLRRRLLAELDHLPVEHVRERSAEGLPKLLVVRAALRLRRRRPEAFGPRSSYAALEVDGLRAGHAVAFARGDAVVTVVPRLVLGLAGGWDTTAVEMPRAAWRNVLTGDRLGGGRVPLDELMARFPVALLEREDT